MITEEESRRWPSLAYQDILRPPAGMRTGWALITSYSLELRAVAATLLALAGTEWESAGGSAQQLVRAVQQLRGRVRFAVQQGRIAPFPGSRNAPLLVMLDSFISEVKMDEAKASWHPKVALVRFDPQTDALDQSLWRLWIGSRNLTSSENLELGVVFESSADGMESAVLKSELEKLALASKLTKTDLRKEMDGFKNLRWVLPEHWKQATVQIRGGKREELPKRPTVVKDMVVVSPFLDRTTVQDLKMWATGVCRPKLLSTSYELSRLATEWPGLLEGWELYTLASPNYPEDTDSAEEVLSVEDRVGVEREEILNASLHAKLIAVATDKDVRFWMGSANATRRGWKGLNTEAVVEAVAGKKIWAGMLELLERSTGVSVQELLRRYEAEDEADRRLEDARKTLAARWPIHIARRANLFEAVADASPPIRADIELHVGTLLGPTHLWPHGPTRLALGAVLLADQSELLKLCLRLGEKSVCWMTRCKVVPPLEAGRDASAIARALQPSEFLRLMTDQLREVRSEEEDGTEWASAGVAGRAKAAGHRAEEELSLEDVLRFWGKRGPAEFNAVFHPWNAVLNEMKNATDRTGDPAYGRLVALHELCRMLIEGDQR